MPNNIRAIKFLNWYFLRIGLDDLDFTKPLEWVGGGQGGGDVTKDMIITKSETMPDASSVSTGAVYMYVGETNETYTHGYIYERKNDEDIMLFDIFGISCSWNALSEFLATKTDDYDTIVAGTMTYIESGNLWKIVFKNAGDETVFEYQQYSTDWSEVGFTFTGTFTDGATANFTRTPALTAHWERMDVQPMGSSGGAVQISVNGRTTVSGYSVPNPTAEEMTAIYNAVVAGNNVQIVDSNNVYYQVIMADSMDGAINIEILYFSEMALIYSLEHDVVTVESKKIGGASIDDSSTATDKTWSANKINGLIGNVESLINAL